MKTMKSVAVLVVLMAGAVSIAAQTSPSTANNAVACSRKPAPSASTTKFGERYPRYKIGSGDSFDVNFELSPEFNQTVTVQPDGFITLRGVGDVNVAGQTVPELTPTLKTAYAKILNDPQRSEERRVG